MLHRVQSATELRRIWRDLVASLQRDLTFASRLARDPIGTLRDLGYEVTDEAAIVLRRALP
ncbi:MAG: hypothetical protein IT385_30845 [Deltaproteobacteria bacterium]|nr:hypothetical protein [Deltaproteobacteria bacterium]